MLSWLDAIEARNQHRVNDEKTSPTNGADLPVTSGPRESFTRVLYVARVGKGVSTADMESYHQQIMEQLQSYHEAKLTGVLLVHAEAVLHLLEGPADILASLFRHFNISSVSNKYNEIRMLLASEDCPERRLPCWTHYVAQNTGVPEKDVTIDKEHIHEEIFDLYSKLVEFGQLLSASEETTCSAQYQQHMRRAVGQLPSNERLLAYTSSLTSDLLPSLEDYLDIYDAPVDIDLEAERVWPLQPTLPPAALVP